MTAEIARARASRAGAFESERDPSASTRLVRRAGRGSGH
jgi:hypothetical protein